MVSSSIYPIQPAFCCKVSSDSKFLCIFLPLRFCFAISLTIPFSCFLAQLFLLSCFLIFILYFTFPLYFYVLINRASEILHFRFVSVSFSFAESLGGHSVTSIFAVISEWVNLFNLLKRTELSNLLRTTRQTILVAISTTYFCSR